MFGAKIQEAQVRRYSKRLFDESVVFEELEIFAPMLHSSDGAFVIPARLGRNYLFKFRGIFISRFVQSITPRAAGPGLTGIIRDILYVLILQQIRPDCHLQNNLAPVGKYCLQSVSPIIFIILNRDRRSSQRCWLAGHQLATVKTHVGRFPDHMAIHRF
jgi:hypothetical protein